MCGGTQSKVLFLRHSCYSPEILQVLAVTLQVNVDLGQTYLAWFHRNKLDRNTAFGKGFFAFKTSEFKLRPLVISFFHLVSVLQGKKPHG